MHARRPGITFKRSNTEKNIQCSKRTSVHLQLQNEKVNTCMQCIAMFSPLKKLNTLNVTHNLDERRWEATK